LQKASAGTAGVVTSFSLPAFMREPKIKVGLIGCGWYGMVIVNAAFKVGGVEIVAVCDVDSEHLENSAREIEKLQGNLPKKFKDYRELLEMKNLEAVIIGTPPQWHALAVCWPPVRKGCIFIVKNRSPTMWRKAKQW